MSNPNVGGIPVRFFKWSPSFSVEDESPVVHVWVSLENLPIFLFHKEALFEIGKMLGVPVKIDGYTANRSKLHQANLCIEMDISKDLPSHFWIGMLDKGVAIKVSYGNIPQYCKHFHKLGHMVAKCLVEEKPENGGNPVHQVNLARVKGSRMGVKSGGRRTNGK